MIQPKLLANDMGDVDLHQRNFIVEGMDGIAFVQTKEEGVPVFIQPKLMENKMGETDL